MTLCPRKSYLFRSNFRCLQKPAKQEAVYLRSWHQTAFNSPSTRFEGSVASLQNFDTLTFIQMLLLSRACTPTGDRTILNISTCKSCVFLFCFSKKKNILCRNANFSWDRDASRSMARDRFLTTCEDHMMVTRPEEGELKLPRYKRTGFRVKSKTSAKATKPRMRNWIIIDDDSGLQIHWREYKIIWFNE